MHVKGFYRIDHLYTYEVVNIILNPCIHDVIQIKHLNLICDMLLNACEDGDARMIADSHAWEQGHVLRIANCHACEHAHVRRIT